MTKAIDRIVFGTDFSETSEHALQYALSLAKRLGARVDVVPPGFCLSCSSFHMRHNDGSLRMVRKSSSWDECKLSQSLLYIVVTKLSRK